MAEVGERGAGLGETSWLALKERAAIPDELMLAIERFDAGSTTAADAAGEWLRTVALDASSARTWVLVASDSVLAFCALASGSVPLTRRQRAEVGSAYRATPATLVAWGAKAADAEVDGAVLLRHADAIAQTVTRLQATCVLALDPFDEDVAELWKQLRRQAGGAAAGGRRDCLGSPVGQPRRPQ